MMATDKRTLRRQLRQTRQKIPQAERQRAQAACNRQLKRFALRGKRIAVYWAMGSELRLDDWVRSAQKRGAKVYLPYIEPHSLRLWFTPYPQTNQRAERKRGKSRLHVPQFVGDKIRANWLHSMVIPIVGIDQHGTRLGQGGGYYDYTIAACSRRPRLIAAGFSCQQVAQLPTESHDIQVDYFVNEKGVWRFNRPNQQK